MEETVPVGRETIERPETPVVPEGHDPATRDRGSPKGTGSGVHDLHSTSSEPQVVERREWEQMDLPSRPASTGPKDRRAPSSALADMPDTHIFPIHAHVNWDWLETLYEGPTPPLNQEVKDWLEDTGIEYTLDIRPIWASSASTITITNARHAVIFKLRWM